MTLRTVLLIVLIPILTGCLVEPRDTASGEIISSYNTQLLTFWGTVATGVLLFFGQIVAIVINSRASKKSEAAIIAANHQNEKLMTITQKLLKTDEKSNATDQRVEQLTNGQHAAALAPPAPIVVVVPAPAPSIVHISPEAGAEPLAVKVVAAVPVPVRETAAPKDVQPKP